MRKKRLKSEKWIVSGYEIELKIVAVPMGQIRILA